MSSDYNVEVAAIDSAMDCFERVEDAATSLRAAATYDVASLGDAIESKLSMKQSELDSAHADLARARELQANDYTEDDDGNRTYHHTYDAEVGSCEADVAALKCQIAKIQALQAKQEMLKESYSTKSGSMLSSIARNRSDGHRIMAAYIRKIQDVSGADISSGTVVNPYTGKSGYAVAVIDSQLHPESAYHIQQAAREGIPLMLTLDRDNADINRKYSLRGYPTREGLDRDEIPPAAFAEGGAGAHIMYISQSDNRGSGSSFRRQLENVPNGTRVRFRVI